MKDPAEILKGVVEAMWPGGKVDCNAARVDAKIGEILATNGLAPAWVYKRREEREREDTLAIPDA